MKLSVNNALQTTEETGTISTLSSVDNIIEEVINSLKSNGSFDQFRKDCIAKMNSKQDFISLTSNVALVANEYTSSLVWIPSMSMKKVQMREGLRAAIVGSSLFYSGVSKIVNQTVDQMYNSEFSVMVDELIKKILVREHQQENDSCDSDSDKRNNSSMETNYNGVSSDTSSATVEIKIPQNLRRSPVLCFESLVKLEKIGCSITSSSDMVINELHKVSIPDDVTDAPVWFLETISDLHAKLLVYDKILKILSVV